MIQRSRVWWINVGLCLLSLVCFQNVVRHFYHHSSFSKCVICVDPSLRHSISFADQHCNEHEIAADFTSIGNLVYAIFSVNYHIITVLCICSILSTSYAIAPMIPNPTPVGILTKGRMIRPRIRKAGQRRLGNPQ